MNTSLQVLKYGFLENVRGRLLIGFGAFFLATTWVLLNLQGDPARAVVSLLELVLTVVPLVGLVFGTGYVYNSREFMELLMVQPVRRRTVFLGHYFGFAAPLAAVFAAATGVPFLFGDSDGTGPAVALLLIAGLLLIFITSALAYGIALRFDDRVRGLGVALFIWLVLVFLYDGLLMALTLVLQGYPLEVPLVMSSLLNPIDLSRIAVLMRLDVAALMGYTGAVYQKTLGSTWGTLLIFTSLALWVALPLALGVRRFARKDF